MDDVVNLKCGQCGHINEVPSDWDQPAAFCVKCGHRIPVPRPESEDAGEVHEFPAEEVGFAEQARKAGGRKITVTCSQCGKTVTVSARVAGRKARCKGCGAPMDIPYPDDLEAANIPRFRNGQDKEALDLVAPGESSGESDRNDDSDGMVDLLPEPIGDEVEEEGVHDPLPEVTPLTGQPATTAGEPNPRPAPADVAAALSGQGSQPAQEFSVPAETPPPPQETSEEADELAYALKDVRAGRVAALAKKRKAARIRTLVSVGVAIGVCGLLVAIGSALWPVLFPPEAKHVDITDNPTPVIGANQPNQATPSTNVASVNPPVPTPTTGQGLPTPPPLPKPKPQHAECKVTDIATSTFGPDGYYPAAIGSVYWKMPVEIKAAAKPIRFRANGQNVHLTFDGRDIPCLGVATDASSGPLPQLARQDTIEIQPGKSRKLTLLFEVPVGSSEGELVIGDLKKPFRIAARVDKIDPSDLPGVFVESPPRNLKPMLDDPVMSAIQRAGRQQLTLKPSRGAFEVEIPQARVRGQASPISADAYKVDLRWGPHKLAAKLRFVHGGKTAILYLADKPFHQMTYVIANVKPAPAPTPPATEPKPEPVEPPPAPPATAGVGEYKPPKNDPYAGKANPLPTGPSIFDR